LRQLQTQPFLFGPGLQVTHARSGGNIEVMGLMQGKVIGDTMIVMDAFALPVEGTETRVSAQDQAYEYMVAYMEKIKEVWPSVLPCHGWMEP
jgi:proteasome lid subunit RPN8/RPN11